MKTALRRQISVLWTLKCIPSDVSEYIEGILKIEMAIISIQCVFRGFLIRRNMFPHRFHKKWNDLRKLLKTTIKESGLPGSTLRYLENHTGVRSEWLLEPQSWISTMQGSKSIEIIKTVRKECEEGLWGGKSDT
jgi:hypothetical protein